MLRIKQWCLDFCHYFPSPHPSSSPRSRLKGVFFNQKESPAESAPKSQEGSHPCPAHPHSLHHQGLNREAGKIWSEWTLLLTPVPAPPVTLGTSCLPLAPESLTGSTHSPTPASILSQFCILLRDNEWHRIYPRNAHDGLVERALHLRVKGSGSSSNMTSVRITN